MDYSKYFTAPVLSSVIIGTYSYFTGNRNLRASITDAGINFASIAINEPITNLLFDTQSINRNQKQIDSYRMYIKPVIASGIYSIIKTKRDLPNYTLTEATSTFNRNLLVSFGANLAGTSTDQAIKKYY